ncbi:hypothetical protein [Veronia pacifica]|uniref:Uncharacterized protein n=1 Tax=Veronia pacifica TaxID=1080227 RepID=A0A1C3EL77_9GAMM|nr:hypothetical protein [Veronia pacifica]ODA33997.1 hypothetical protein A8L45_08095 [Veronia pacifica]
MTEEEALDKAQNHKGDHRSYAHLLLELQPYISDEKFGWLWEGFIAAAPFEVVMELNGGDDNVVSIER